MAKALTPKITINIAAAEPPQAEFEVFPYDIVYHLGSCTLYVVRTEQRKSDGIWEKSLRTCLGPGDMITFGNVTYSRADYATGRLFLSRANWRRVSELCLNIRLEP